MNIEPRESPPTERAGWDDQCSFRVWVNEPPYAEDPTPWRCAAAFRFLTECLNYIAYCQDCGVDVVFQSPAETKLIRATDRRAVFNPACSDCLVPA